MSADRFKGLTNGGRPRTGERSIREQLLATHTQQVTDLHHAASPSEAQHTDAFGRRDVTPAEIKTFLHTQAATPPKNPRIHPNTPADWRIPDLPESTRKKKRHHR